MAPRALRVATWNVHSCVGTDGRPDPDRVAAVIREIDADIVGVQELDDRENHPAEAHLATLASMTGLRPVACPTMWGTHGGFGNALLSREKPYRVRDIDLSVQRREPRRALHADLILDDGHHIRLVVTHFGLKARERARQAAALLGALGDVDDQRPLIVCGDINEWRPRARVMRSLEERLGRSTALASWPSLRPLLALDRIFVRPPSAIRRAWVHDTVEARRASDHLPVVADVELAL